MRNPSTRASSMRRGTGAIADGRPPATRNRIEKRRRVDDAASSSLTSVETAPEDARRDAGVAAERGGERAGLAEPDREADMGDRVLAGEQRLGPLDAPARDVAQ